MSESPYPGPRPFEQHESRLFFGRSAVLRDLRSLIIAHRLILLYAQSGAGKTSLLNAGLVPLLREHGGVHVLPIARVRTDLPVEIGHHDGNPYVFSSLITWSDADTDPQSLGDDTLASFLRRRWPPLDAADPTGRRLIIFDQLEELFTFHPKRPQDREEFLRQVAECLEEDPTLRALLVIREDYLATLDSHRDVLPLRTRYRLERLRPSAARLAIEGPLRHTNRSYAEGVALKLVQILIDAPGGSLDQEDLEESGLYVEPVQLQIVCRDLWQSLPKDVAVITLDQLDASTNVKNSLRRFYESVLRRAVSAAKVPEEVLRRWFQDQLITPENTRATVFRGKEATGGLPNEAIDSLERDHVIRAEQRAGGRWYELTHDQFIEPLKESNTAWLHEHRARRQRRRLAAYSSAVLLVLVLLSVLAIQSARDTERNSVLAKADGLVARATNSGRSGDLQRATALLREASALYADVGESAKQLAAVVTLGNLLFFAARYEDAASAYGEALQLSRDIGDPASEAGVLERLASATGKQGTGQSRELFEESRKLYEQVGDLQGAGRVLEHAAAYAEQRDELKEAEQLYQSGERVYERAGDEFARSRVRTALERVGARLRPWGYLLDLQRGNLHELKGEDVRVGRNLPDMDVINDIDFQDRFVSRHHFEIRRNLSIEDLRSTNGTTVNGRSLPYGMATKLQDADIVVVGGVVALRFFVRQPKASRAPRPAWALFVDSGSKSYEPLTMPAYDVVREGDRLSVRTGAQKGVWLRLRRRGEKVEMFDVRDKWTLAYTVIDRGYATSYPLQDGVWLEADRFPMFFAILGPEKSGRQTVKEYGPAFQLAFGSEGG